MVFQSNDNDAGRELIPTLRVKHTLCRVERQICHFRDRREIPKNGCTTPFQHRTARYVKHHDQGYGSCSSDPSDPNHRPRRCIRCRLSPQVMAVESDRSKPLSRKVIHHFAVLILPVMFARILKIRGNLTSIDQLSGTIEISITAEVIESSRCRWPWDR